MSGLLAAAPAAAPAVPAAAITGALILASFAWIVLWGTMHGYDYSFGALMRKFADMVEDIWVVGGTLADALRGLDTFVLRQMGNGLDGLEDANARLWEALTWIVRETGDALVDFGADVFYAITGLVDAVIPFQVKARTEPLSQGLAAQGRIEEQRARQEALTRTRGIDALGRNLTAEALARERGIDRIEALITTLVLPRIRSVEQGLADVWGFTRRNLRIRIGRLEQALAAGVVGAVAVAAITRLAPYWQCTNVRRFNRTLCRMGVPDLSALLGLLAGTALLALALDPRVLAKAAEKVTTGLEGIIRQTAIRD